jgi:acyl transferase domain-containing protein
LLTALGKLWLAGTQVDWQALHAPELRRRVPLPTYPFDRRRYWVEQLQPSTAFQDPAPLTGKRPRVADWLYTPVWKQSYLPLPGQPKRTTDTTTRWLIFADDMGLGTSLTRCLQERSQEVITVRVGREFGRTADREFLLNPQARADYDRLLAALSANGGFPEKVVHLWSVAPIASFDEAQGLGFESILYFVQRHRHM